MREILGEIVVARGTKNSLETRKSSPEGIFSFSLFIERQLPINFPLCIREEEESFFFDVGTKNNYLPPSLFPSSDDVGNGLSATAAAALLFTCGAEGGSWEVTE